MTPHKASHGKGTYTLDRVFAGVGRIRRASGTTDKRVFGGINTMLDDLYSRGIHGPLEAMRDGKLKPLAAYSVYRVSSALMVPDAPALELIDPAWQAWAAKTPNASTRRQRLYAWSHLEASLSGRAAITALPGAVQEVREALAEHPPAFNRILAAAQAFVRDTLGDGHPIYRQVTAVGRRTEEVVKRKAPSIDKALETRDRLSGEAKAIWWSLYTTGMGPKEYDGRWDVEGEAVAIHGKKRKGRDRIVPLISQPVRRAMGWKQYRAALAPVQIYDARRGFRHLLEEARIPMTRIRQYMGHRAVSVTDGYGQVELAEFVVADGEAIRNVLAMADATRKKTQKQQMRA